MRLKKLDFTSSCSSYKEEQSKALNEMSDNVNRIGSLFDKFCEIEDFVLDRIKTRLIELGSIKDNRTNIEKEFSTQEYLKKFKLSSDKLILRIDESIEEWDNLSDKSIKNIVSSIEELKELSEMLTKIKESNNKFDTVESLINLVNEFGRFKLIKIIMTSDIGNKINLLIQYKANLIIENEKKKVLSIDDL